MNLNFEKKKIIYFSVFYLKIPTTMLSYLTSSETYPMYAIIFDIIPNAKHIYYNTCIYYNNIYMYINSTL